MPKPSLNVLDTIPALWGIREVAQRIGVDKQTVARLVKKGRFPKPLIISPTVHRWNPATVEAHLTALEASPEAPAAAPDGEEL